VTRYPTRIAVSAGGLVVDERPDGPWVVLIARRTHAGTLLWSLPKGRLEEGEDHETAALREVREETGLECELTDVLGTIDYWFVWREDQVRYHKYVHYYVMRPVGGSLDDRDDEADEAAWMPLSQALAKLAHANERELVAQAFGPTITAGGSGSDERR
jgi:ADP-ribose pyrophosphatase YjhB (NUDIX family)